MLVPVEWLWIGVGFAAGMACVTAFILFVIYKNIVNS